MLKWNARTLATTTGLLTLTLVACGGNQMPVEEPAPQPSQARAPQPSPPQRATPAPSRNEAQERERARAAALRTLEARVHFDYDRAEIKPEYAQVLQEKARVLRQYPNLRITIEGHCDERGSAEYNIALGQRRSEATKRYLVGLGISESRIRTVSFGKERPLMAQSTERDWSQNRRAEFVAQNPNAIAGHDLSPLERLASR